MSRRDQIRMSAEEIDEFLSGRHTMNVASFNHDGTIHLVAMWYAVLDGDPVFWTYGRSQKVKNLQRGPRIRVLVEAGEGYGELRGVELVGRAEIIEDRPAVRAIGEAVYERYFGPVTDETRPFVELTGAKRVGVRVHVDRTARWDHRKLGGAY